MNKLDIEKFQERAKAVGDGTRAVILTVLSHDGEVAHFGAGTPFDIASITNFTLAYANARLSQPVSQVKPPEAKPEDGVA